MAGGRHKRASPTGRSSSRRRARVFWTGRSQAVRLPKEFRFSTKEVAIHREGERVVLEPFEIERDEKGWPTAFWKLAGAAPELDLGDRETPHERGDVFRSKR
jgi:virulence-associated protein VagC